MDLSSLVRDVREKPTGDIKPPSLPQPAPGGFPAPKKRTRMSAFKAQRNGVNTTSTTSTTTSQSSEPQSNASTSLQTSRAGFDVAEERRRIDEENNAKLASMSPAEIARQRQELLDTLPSSLVEMLLQRANIDSEDDQTAVFDSIGAPNGQPPVHSRPPPAINVEDSSQSRPPPAKISPKKVTFDVPEPTELDGPVSQVSQGTEFGRLQGKKSEASSRVDDLAPEEPIDIPFTMEKHHFPAAPALPDLDPNDPNFLETMHKKYFPNLPADPSRLAWMAPLPTENSAADRDSPYYPGQNSLPISALRFDFKGRMISPKRARQIPVTKGLHNHAEAPEAAGYTIAELAIYARSAVPSQRCIAYQTLGRILFRLGSGEWGKGEIAEGIWASVMEGRVLDSLTEAASQEGGHRSSQAYATEALWLLEKGGWKQRHKGR